MAVGYPAASTQLAEFLTLCQDASLLDRDADPQAVVALMSEMENVPAEERVSHRRISASLVAGRIHAYQSVPESAWKLRWPIASLSAFLRSRHTIFSQGLVSGEVIKSQVGALEKYDDLGFTVHNPSSADLLRVRDVLSVEDAAIDDIAAQVGVMHGLDVRWRHGGPTRNFANDGVAIALNRRLGAGAEIVPGHHELHLVLAGASFDPDPAEVRERAERIGRELSLKIGWSHMRFTIVGGC